MIKNEYRRGLIMLRPIAQGYSGHVRLERRTLMGSMYFIVNLPDVPGDIRAVLAGRKNGEYYAAELGTLRRDGRGQANLVYSFDPRDIDGRTLEEYIFVVIARVNGCACEPVLSGNVDGSRDADFSQVEQAVCELLTRECGPAADIPERPFPVAPPPGPVPQRPGRPAPELPGRPDRPIQPSQPGRPESPGQNPDGERPDIPGQDGMETPGVPEPVPRPYPSQPALPEYEMPDTQRPPEPGQAPGNGNERPGGNMENSRPSMRNSGATAVFAASGDRESAAERAGVDASVPWAAAIEGIRSYFAGQPAQNLSFDDDYIYVRAPMPEGSGFPYVMIGIETDDGRIESVRFALPGRFAESPPAGLEGYVWRGGPTEGWWVLTVDPRTGNPIEFDD